MELDELKKSWSKLDKQLQKEPITNEKQIEQLIARCKANTNQSLCRIVGLQRLSIYIGAAALGGVLLISLFFVEQLQNKMGAFLLFITISILSGMAWDWKTYRWSKAISVHQMSVAEVSQRMSIFRQWGKYEMIAASIWIILANILYYWVMKFYLLGAGLQAIFITILVIFNALVIYLLYKKILYKHLDSIHKNIEELKDICTE